MTETSSSAASAGRSLRKAFDLLETLARANRPPTLSELARKWGQPKSSVHRMLGVLADLDLVALEDNRYVLGDYLFDITYHSDRAKAERLRRLLTPHLIELQHRTSGIVSLGLLSGVNVRFVDLMYRHGQAAFVNRIPHLAPVYCTSLGRALLAFRADVVERLQAVSLTKFTANTITNPIDLMVELRRVRKRGFAAVDSEYMPQARAVAAPIHIDHMPPFVALGVACNGPMDLVAVGVMVKSVADLASAEMAARARAIGA